MSLRDLAGGDREKARRILAWACGRLPDFGPDPWGLSPWLAW